MAIIMLFSLGKLYVRVCVSSCQAVRRVFPPFADCFYVFCFFFGWKERLAVIVDFVIAVVAVTFASHSASNKDADRATNSQTDRQSEILINSLIFWPGHWLACKSTNSYFVPSSELPHIKKCYAPVKNSINFNYVHAKHFFSFLLEWQRYEIWVVKSVKSRIRAIEAYNPETQKDWKADPNLFLCSHLPQHFDEIANFMLPKKQKKKNKPKLTPNKKWAHSLIMWYEID